MTDKELKEKAVDLMNLFLSFCDDSEVEKYIDVKNERRSESGEYLLAAIKKWLKDNGFKYHSLLMGKPRGGNYHWIDNHLVKATRYNGKFTDLIEKEVTIEVFDDGQSDN